MSVPGVPRYAAAVIDALNFRSPRDRPPEFSRSEWIELLRFADQTQLTLPLVERWRGHVPDFIEQRWAACRKNVRLRWAGLKQVYRECDLALREADIPFVVLKGFTHCPSFVPAATDRMQYDLDFLCSLRDILPARDALAALGFRPIQGKESVPRDHLPPMSRPTDWKWKGDFFDPEIPVTLELHFRLWDGGREFIEPAGIEEFWMRRTLDQLDGLSFYALDGPDLLGYAALHALRHILRGSLRLSHLYEIARFLHSHRTDAGFWGRWHEQHAGELRALETVVFSLAQRWFDCGAGECVEQESSALPEAVQEWIARCGFSPLAALFRPDKDELWLHWALLRSWQARLAAAKMKLIPRSLPGPISGVHHRHSRQEPKASFADRLRYAAYVAGRSRYHVTAAAPTIARGLAFGAALQIKRWKARLPRARGAAACKNARRVPLSLPTTDPLHDR